MVRVAARKIKPGDILRFYIGDGLFAYARVLFHVDRMVCLVEIFDFTAKEQAFDPKILNAQRLLPIQPIAPVDMMGKHWKWKVVYRDDAFEPPNKEIEKTDFLLAIAVCITRFAT